MSESNETVAPAERPTGSPPEAEGGKPDVSAVPDDSGLQAKVDELSKLVEALTADKAEATKKAEEEAASAEAERKAKLSEKEAMQERVAELEGKLQATESRALADARSNALSAMRIPEKFHGFAPADADPRTGAGKEALERWVADNSELQTRGADPGALSPRKNDKLLSKARSGNPFLANYEASLSDARNAGGR